MNIRINFDKIIEKTEKAVFIKTVSTNEQVCLPLSQIEINEEKHEITLPDWIAKKEKISRFVMIADGAEKSLYNIVYEQAIAAGLKVRYGWALDMIEATADDEEIELPFYAQGRAVRGILNKYMAEF